jgi:hypothetical protein
MAANDILIIEYPFIPYNYAYIYTYTHTHQFTLTFTGVMTMAVSTHGAPLFVISAMRIIKDYVRSYIEDILFGCYLWCIF